MATDRIGWGIIGCGVIGPWHAQAVEANEQAELIQVCDVVPERAKKLAEDNDCSYVTSVDELLANDDIQAVSICTPSGMHSDHAVAAAQAGKHILCEKPLDVTLEAIDAMIDAAADNNVKLAGVFQRRTYATSKKVRDAIRNGKLGKLILGDSYQKGFRSHEYYASGDWRATWALDGGGCMMNQGVHAIDMIVWLMGDVARVSAYCRRLARNIEVEDTVVANVEYVNGALGTWVSTTSVTPSQGMRFEIHGDRGSIVLAGNEITQWAIEGEEEVTGEEGEDKTSSDATALNVAGHIEHVRDLCEAIINDRDPAIPGAEARKAVEVIKAVYLSSRLGGQSVELPLSYEDDGPGIYPSQSWSEW